MRTSWLIALAAIGVASNARAEAFIAGPDASEAAESSTLTIGTPSQRATIKHAKLAMLVKRTRVLATLTLDVDGAGKDIVDVAIPLKLPAGSRATGMTVTIDGVRTVAHAMNTTDALTLYNDTVGRAVDPALLELDGSGWYRLRVFPIAKGKVGRVDISVEFPRPEVFTIEPVGHVIEKLVVDVAGQDQVLSTTAVKLRTPKRISVPAGAAEETPKHRRTAVDLMTSLVAGRPGQINGVPTVRGDGFHAYSHGSLDKQMIRTRIQYAMPRLTHCYERELLRNPKLVGDSTLSFSIQPSGMVSNVSIVGTLEDDAVRTCLHDVVASLEFPKTDATGAITVNYPLTFKLAN
jgi:hypothetical protein